MCKVHLASLLSIYPPSLNLSPSLPSEAHPVPAGELSLWGGLSEQPRGGRRRQQRDKRLWKKIQTSLTSFLGDTFFREVANIFILYIDRSFLPFTIRDIETNHKTHIFGPGNLFGTRESLHQKIFLAPENNYTRNYIFGTRDRVAL